MSVNEGAMRGLPEEVRQTLRPYLAEVKKLFGASLEAVILYGSGVGADFLPGTSNINLLILLARQEVDLLQRYSKVHQRWQKENIVVPLFLTADELRGSAGLFPLEFLEIKDRHELLFGRDPFPELHLDLSNLHLQCVQEIQGNLLRLRQRFVEGGGTVEAAAILLPLSLTALLPCFRGLFRTSGYSFRGSSEALLKELESRLGVDPAVFLEVLNVKRGLISPGQLEFPRLLARYLDALVTVVKKTNSLERQA